MPAHLATSAVRYGGDLLGRGIDLPEAGAAAGRRRHPDLAVLEPLEVAGLRLPGAEEHDCLAAVNRCEQEARRTVLTRASRRTRNCLLLSADQMMLLSLPKYINLLRLASRGVRLALGHRNDVEIGVVAIRFVACARGRQLGDGVTLARDQGIRAQLCIGAEDDPLAVRRNARRDMRVVGAGERLVVAAAALNEELDWRGAARWKE